MDHDFLEEVSKESILLRCIFDTGANLSCITLSLLDSLGLSKYIKWAPIKPNERIKTYTGDSSYLGKATLNITIGLLSSDVELHVFEKSNHPDDLLIGLDLIYLFRLGLDPNMKVYQRFEDQQPDHQITTNYTFPELFVNLLKSNEEYDHLSVSQLKLLDKILDKSNCFSKDKWDIGCIQGFECEIPLQDNIPIFLKPYRTSWEDELKVQEEVDLLREHGIIEYSDSPYSFPVVLVDKKDDGKKSRFCVDYRKLNAKSIPNNHPFPRIEDIIDDLRDCQFFTTLDVTSGFWNILVKENDRDKLAFSTKKGHFTWKRLPFGWRNSPAVFQSILCRIIRKHNLHRFCHNYLDDILIFSKTYEEHLHHIELVLKAIEQENIKLKISKCSFAQQKVKYLGHMISKNKVHTLSSNTKAIEVFPPPKKVRELQSFLGKVNFYRKFIPNIATMLHPLYELLKTSVSFKWTDECQSSFEKIKNLLIQSPVLRIYNPKAECFLFTDASGKGVAGVLKQFQSDDNEYHTIGYFSKKLLHYQKNYSATELELLAIVESINYWHHYLSGMKFTVVTDHQALKYLRTLKKTNSRLLKWSLKLDMYWFDVIYRKGSENTEADCLSRSFPEDEVRNFEHIKMINLITEATIREHTSSLPDDQYPKRYRLENGLIKVRKGLFDRIFIPRSLVSELIETFHREFKHIGITQMCMLISKKYLIRNLSKLVSDYVKSCVVCVEAKTRQQLVQGKLSTLGPPERPLQIISIDTVGGFAGFRSNCVNLHVAVDFFTKYVWALPSKTKTGKDIKNLLKIIRRDGNPSIILADLYPGNNSEEVESYLAKHNIELINSPAGSLISLGLSSRTQQTIVTRLRCNMVETDFKHSWITLLQSVVAAYNLTPHTSTGYSPNFLLNGEPLDPSIDLATARQNAAEKNALVHEKNKKRFEKNKIPVRIDVGDQVYIPYSNRIKRGKLGKLNHGPFEVIQKKSDTIFIVSVEGEEVPVRISQIRTT